MPLRVCTTWVLYKYTLASLEFLFVELKEKNIPSEPSRPGRRKVPQALQKYLEAAPHKSQSFSSSNLDLFAVEQLYHPNKSSCLGPEHDKESK